ncbi:MAG: ATP-binding protein [Campylobacterota bacterium]|nr:ATP-binding protein [Campylobacterota bacterium]
MQNPFNYFSIATDNNFCNRDKDIELLKKYILNSSNVVLFSKRRYGKTTLIKEVLKNHLPKSIYKVYIDLYGIQDKYDFIQRLSLEISKLYSVGDIKQTLLNLKNIFTKISFSLTINQKTAMPEIKPEFIKKDFQLLLDELLDGFVNFLDTNNKKAVIAMDEFQEILNIKEIDIEAILRTKIQYHKNVSYIFTGSKQHLLTNMFNNNKKPFYAMSTNFELKPIDEDIFFEYSKKRFKLKDITLTKEIFSNIYNLCDKETRAILKICYELFEHNKNSTINNKILDNIIEMINLQNDSVYRLLSDTLTTNQIIVLKIIANEYKEILSLEISKKYNISIQSIKSAINSLMKKELLYKNENKYIVYDKEFDFWLK